MSTNTLPASIDLFAWCFLWIGRSSAALRHHCSRSIMYELSMEVSDLHKSHHTNNYLLTIKAWIMNELRWQKESTSGGKVSSTKTPKSWVTISPLAFPNDAFDAERICSWWACFLWSHWTILRMSQKKDLFDTGRYNHDPVRVEIQIYSLVSWMGRMWSKSVLHVRLALGIHQEETISFKHDSWMPKWAVARKCKKKKKSPREIRNDKMLKTHARLTKSK